MLQGQNSRLLPVTASATLASIATSIYNSVPAGATYSPSSSVTLGVHLHTMHAHSAGCPDILMWRQSLCTRRIMYIMHSTASQRFC